MTHLHHHRIRQGMVATLTGALAVLVPWTIAPLTAHAAPECTETISGPNSGVLNVAADEQLSRPVDQDLLGCGVGGLTVGSFD